MQSCRENTFLSLLKVRRKKQILWTTLSLTVLRFWIIGICHKDDDTSKIKLPFPKKSKCRCAAAHIVKIWSTGLWLSLFCTLLSQCDGTTEVNRGKINDKSQPDLLSVETLICRAVGGKRNPLAATMIIGSVQRGCNHVEIGLEKKVKSHYY